MLRVGAGLVLIASLAAAALLAGAPPVANAACLLAGRQSSDDFGFAAAVGRSADLIVLARVIELNETTARLQVLRVLKGSAERQVEATAEAVSDSCTRPGPVEVGDQLIYVEGASASGAPPNFAFVRARTGGWQHNFNWYASTKVLVAKMQLLPDTAVASQRPERDAYGLHAALAAGSAALAGVATLMFRRRIVKGPPPASRWRTS